MITPEFSRLVPVEKIGPGGLSRAVEASAAECAALARRLGVPAVVSLSCDFTLRRGDDAARGEVVADGALRAVLARTCVVSLEDFEQPMAARFRVLFVWSGTEREDTLAEEADEIPYDGAMIDLGEAAAEQVALDLDPYPRSPGAVLPDEATDATASPFAALRRPGVPT
jgi:uncharacterized metal-binding protein YceD (DUF177 family)